MMMVVGEVMSNDDGGGVVVGSVMTDDDGD